MEVAAIERMGGAITAVRDSAEVGSTEQTAMRTKWFKLFQIQCLHSMDNSSSDFEFI